MRVLFLSEADRLFIALYCNDAVDVVDWRVKVQKGNFDTIFEVE